MEHDFLTKVSILIPVIGRAWPWIAGVGMCLALLQSLGGCLARIYLAYRMKGFGLWLIPAALGITMMLVIIPVTILRRIWANLASGRIPGASVADDPDDSDLRGPKTSTQGPRASLVWLESSARAVRPDRRATHQEDGLFLTNPTPAEVKTRRSGDRAEPLRGT